MENKRKELLLIVRVFLSSFTRKRFPRKSSDRISSTAIEFAQKILEINQNKLLKFSKNLS
jgi:hypothetical protein